MNGVYRLAWILLALVLMVAGVAKLLARDVALYSYLATLLNIALSVSLLVASENAKVRLAVGTFFLFSFVHSIARLLGGHSSCGCFGDIKTDPLEILILSATVECVLVASFFGRAFHGDDIRTFLKTAESLSRTALAVVSIYLLANVFLIHNQANTIRSSVSDWRGTVFPLIDRIRISGDIDKGRWLLILVRQDCEKCEAVINHLTEVTDAQVWRHEDRTIGIIYVTSDDGAGPPVRPCGQGRWVCGTLNVDSTITVPTPAKFVLYNGVVEQVVVN